MAVRSGALNLYRKNNRRQQVSDIKRAMGRADILSLSEVHDRDIQRWAKANGYGYVAGPDDTAILFNPRKVRMVPGTKGSRRLNTLTGSTGGMRSRQAAYAQFEEVGSGKKFWQISAHTTPPRQGTAARRTAIRRQQYQSLAKLSRELSGGDRTPVLIGGDLNFRDPNIKGFESGFDGGIMHVMGRGASTIDLATMKKLNSDHKAVFGTYRLDGGGNNTVNLKADGFGGGGGGRDGGGRRGGGGDGVPDNINRREMAASYGFALSFMNSSPELKKLFDQAVKQTWTPDRFIANLRGTKWFKKHSASVRNAILQEKADPATYKANVDQMFATVRDTWGSTFGTAGMNTRQMRAWAETAHRMGWSEAQLMDRMTAQVNWSKMLGNRTLGGTAAQVETQLESLTHNYGLPLSRDWRARNLEKIVKGNDTIEGVANRVRELAKREYAAFADQIDAGASVREIADPYVSKMAELLELNPNDIDITKDQMIQAALKAKSKDGKPAALNFGEFQDMIRRDQRWKFTKNAKEQVAGVTENLLRNFGILA